MISRAVRVPRICLACRFGLITQRSAGLGFRPNPVREGIGRRLYTSDISGDSRIESFIPDKDVPKRDSEREPVEEESTTTTTTPSKNAAESTNSAPTTEIDSKSTRTPEETSIGFAQTEPDNPVDEASPLGGESDYTSTNLSNKPASEQRLGSMHELDELIDDNPTRPDLKFDVIDLPELDDGFSGSDQKTRPWPKRKFRDELLHEESLGVPSLGLPADAIVINNPNKTRIERKAPIVVEEEEAQPANIDWESMNPAEPVEPPTEEINANIEEFRPDTRILRLADIQSLIESLCSGFTTNQLKDYHRDRQPEQQQGEIMNYSWVEESVPWTSINSIQVRGIDKTAIAQKIVLYKWGIEVMEHENDLGKAYVRMDPYIFPFLLYGPNNISRLLWELRRDFLVGEDEKLTLSVQRSRLNITARKSTTYGVLAYIDQCLQKMHTRTIDVAPYLPRDASLPKSAELKELGRLTKTSIRRVKEGTKNKFMVSWLPDSDEAPAGTEDRADMVFRLMAGLTVPVTDNVLQCIPSRGDKAGGQFVQVRRQTRAMSWRDKLGRWFRVVDPVTKPNWSAKETSPLKLAASAAFINSKPGEAKEITTATFGHVLHSESDDSMKSLSRKRRILLPFTPHPASFSALKPDDDKPIKESTTIVINLVPHEERKSGRSSDAQKGNKHPAVRINIPVNPGVDFDKFRLPDNMTADFFAFWHVNDVLLPGEAVDVRLQHERSQVLKLTTNPNLQTFLEASQFKLDEGKLRTPSQAMLHVPEMWLGGRQPGLYSQRKKQDVLYDFRGTEIHQTIEMSWRGHTLRYSSIEAGQQGGQRQEITLQAGTPSESPVTFNGERRASFLQLVEEIATGKCFSWHEGYQSIKNRQLEDYSYNLPERELTDDIIVEDKFDSRGHFKAVEREKRKRQSAPKAQKARKSQASSETDAFIESTNEPVFDDIDKLLAAENEDSIETKTEVEEESIQHQETEELMALLDIPSKQKAAAYEGDKQPSIVESATATEAAVSEKQITNSEGTTKDEAPSTNVSETVIADASSDENGVLTVGKKSATAAKHERVRNEILNNFFGGEALMTEATAASDDKNKTKNKPSAARKAKVATRKYTIRDLEQPAKKKKNNNKMEEDPFLAQFAARATSNNRVADPNAVAGFFDTLPPEKNGKPKGQSRSSGSIKGSNKRR
ncbi:hypothetical protein NW768_001695 [Fusarium equiseti]|uniref:Uncharacterized protein n=1 Tax=Fusarium equiseti TaxID=61235 RepID=A0ABQ8RR99_FUSEQ|nr:hypothetical protein NW768_001695 [Fusarium equiseti]